MSLPAAQGLSTEHLLKLEQGSPLFNAVDKIHKQLATKADLAALIAALKSTDDGKGASQIFVKDAGGNFTADDLEAVLVELYTAATTGGSDSFTDTNNYYAVDQVGAALVALASQLGGDDDANFNFTGNVKLADNDPVYTALDKLDLEQERTAIVPVATADILALHTTPKELVPAPGAGFYLEPISITLKSNFGTVALDDANGQGDLRFKYSGGTVIATQEADGVVDVAAGSVYRHIREAAPGAIQDMVPANEAIQLDNDGTGTGAFTDPGGADTTMELHVRYRVRSLF